MDSFLPDGWRLWSSVDRAGKCEWYCWQMSQTLLSQ
jgi:hypothetical protein